MQNSTSQGKLERRIRKGLLPFRSPELDKKITGRRIETNEFMCTNGGESFNSNKFPIVVTVNKKRPRRNSDNKNDDKFSKENFSCRQKGNSTHIEVERSYSTRIERAKIKILNGHESKEGFKDNLNKSNKRDRPKSKSCVMKNLKSTVNNTGKTVKMDKSVQADDLQFNKIKTKILKKIKAGSIQPKDNKKIKDEKLNKHRITVNNDKNQLKKKNVNKANCEDKPAKKECHVEKQKAKNKNFLKKKQATQQVISNNKTNLTHNNEKANEKPRDSITEHKKTQKETKKCRIENNKISGKTKVQKNKSLSNTNSLFNKAKKNVVKKELAPDSTLKKSGFVKIKKNSGKSDLNDSQPKINQVIDSNKGIKHVLKIQDKRNSIDFNSVFKLLIKELYSAEKKLDNNNEPKIDKKVFNELEQLLKTRKKALKATFKQMNLQINSENSKKELMKWYYQEILFIQQINLCLKLKDRVTNNTITEVSPQCKPKTLNSNLKNKKISSKVDLSFNSNDLLARRRSSNLISDPDVTNLKAEYLGPIKKKISKSDLEQPICFSMATDLSIIENTPGFFLAEGGDQMLIYNKLCDNVVDDMIGVEIEVVLSNIMNAVSMYQKNTRNREHAGNTIETLVLDTRELIEFIINQFSESIVSSLNRPYGYYNIELMQLLNTNTEVDLSLYAEYSRQPIITKDMQETVLKTIIHPNQYIKIYKKLLLDCLNEALCTWRPFVYKYEPFPWQIVSGNSSKNLIESKDLSAVGDLTLIKIKEWSMLVCGYLNDKEDSYMGAAPIADYETLEAIKEDRLVKYINWEIYENEDRWTCYDLEYLETMVNLEQEIWNELVIDLAQNFLK